MTYLTLAEHDTENNLCRQSYTYQDNIPQYCRIKQQFILKALQLMLPKNYTGHAILQALERKTKHEIIEIY